MDILIKDIDDKVVKKLDILADKEKRSRSQQIILILEKSVE